MPQVVRAKLSFLKRDLAAPLSLSAARSSAIKAFYCDRHNGANASLYYAIVNLLPSQLAVTIPPPGNAGVLMKIWTVSVPGLP